MVIDGDIGVAQFAGKLHVHRKPAELFDGILSGQAGIVGRSAGSDDDLMEMCQILLRQGEAVQHDLVILQAWCQSPLYGLGLFHDLLHHEVLIAALFRRRNA